jgi:hypothetical protein
MAGDHVLSESLCGSCPRLEVHKLLQTSLMLLESHNNPELEFLKSLWGLGTEEE